MSTQSKVNTKPAREIVDYINAYAFKASTSMAKIGQGCKMDSKAIADMAQEILDDLDSKRMKDKTLCSDFQIAMDSQVDKIMQFMDNIIAHNCEEKNAEIETKLQELCAINARIEKLENELNVFRKQLRDVFAPFLADK